MTNIDKDAALARIRSNIEAYRYHLYVVRGAQCPRLAYTIGVSEMRGAELILAGAAIYSNDEVRRVIDAFVSSGDAARLGAEPTEVDSLGTFSLREVHGSWARVLILGAVDYYKSVDIPAIQIVPDKDHWTIDVPDLSRPHSPQSEPVWRWLTEPWEYTVPEGSTAITNLDALRGQRVTEAARWELDEWELFAGAGPDVSEEDSRRVGLGTLLAADPSLRPVTALAVGKALWRGSTDLQWQDWGK